MHALCRVQSGQSARGNAIANVDRTLAGIGRNSRAAVEHDEAIAPRRPHGRVLQQPRSRPHIRIPAAVDSLTLSRLGYSSFAIGAVTAVSLIAVILCGPFYPRVIVRLGLKRCIVSGIVFAAAILLVMPVWPG